MSPTEHPSPNGPADKPEIYVDDDWKQRVKAEDTALDETFKADAAESPSGETVPQAASEAAAATPGPQPQQLPPATFEMLVGMLSTQATVALGLIPNPTGEKAETQFDLARHCIDLLGVLESKTEGNLQEAEKSLLDETLHQLRMAYVEIIKQASTETKPTAPD